MEHRNSGSAGEAFAALTGAAYAALFLLGVVVGVLGCFHFSAAAFNAPIGVIVAIVVNVGMCWLGGLGMRSKLGAALPAGGWLLVVLVFSVQRPEGDFVVANSAIGLTFLFGGTVAAGVGIGIAPSAWMRRSDARVVDAGGDSVDSVPGRGSSEDE